MAPRLAESQRNLIHDMIISKSFTTRQIADVAGCSIRGVKRLRSNIRVFGSVKAPWNGG
jgi:DNA-binding CsgD family transcriptional regulator